MLALIFQRQSISLVSCEFNGDYSFFVNVNHKIYKQLNSIIKSIKSLNRLRLKFNYEEWYHHLTYGEKYDPYVFLELFHLYDFPDN